MRRYSLGITIEKLFSELLALISEAQFSAKEERLPLIGRAITKNDQLKFTILALWELDGISEVHFTELAVRLEEVGRMLYGWKQKIISEGRSQEKR